MTAVVTIATILVTLGGYLDFLLGEPGNRKLKDRLVDFYISVEEGDWSALYRLPARTLLGFAQNLLGTKVISGRFAIRAIVFSVIITAIMLMAYLAIVYLEAVWRQTDECRAPPLLMTALEVPFYLRHVLYQVFVVNAFFDVVTWSTIIYSLRVISVTRNKFAPFGVILFSMAFAVLILHLLHSVYLPISIAERMREYGMVFSNSFYLKFFRNGFLTPLQEIFRVRGFIGVSCYLPPAEPFSISHISLTQYAALEALIPVILFVIACLLGSVAYLTRRLTHKPAALIIDRLAASKNVCVTIAALLSGLIAILKIVVGFTS